MAKNKTIETRNSVTEYLHNIHDDSRRKDCSAIIELISHLTALEPKMWGAGIVGFGSYHYKYESGHEGDAPLAAFASRANAIVLYLATNFERKEELLQQFGKHKVGKSCIYIQKLKDVNTDVLSKMIIHSIADTKAKYPS